MIVFIDKLIFLFTFVHTNLWNNVSFSNLYNNMNKRFLYLLATKAREFEASSLYVSQLWQLSQPSTVPPMPKGSSAVHTEYNLLFVFLFLLDVTWQAKPA